MSRRRRSSYSQKELESSRSVPLLSPTRVRVGLLVIAIAAVSYLGIRNYRRILPGSDRSHQAILEAEAAVRRNFGAGITIRFGQRESTKVEPSAGGFNVRGWVQAVSSDGGTSQGYAYSCTVTEDLLGNWSVEHLSLEVTDAPVHLK